MIKLLLRQTEAQLVHGVWSSIDADMAVLLNRSFSIKLYPPSPSERIPHERQAKAAATVLGGKVVLPDVVNDSREVVY